VRSVCFLVLLAAAVALPSGRASTAEAQDRLPAATLIPATTITLNNGNADSNSPAVWELIDGRETLFVFTSFNGWANRLFGSQLQALSPLGPVTFAAPPPHGVWIEAIVPDVDGTWYGYYHNELPADVCGDASRTLPRIGAARSIDFGATWEDLGVVLEAPPDSYDCDTTNRYFVGGVGDFSVILDQNQTYLYFFFSQYSDREQSQGVAVARLPWAYRDRPRGRVSVWWRGPFWLPPRANRMRSDGMDYTYAAGVPIYRARDGWHDDRTVDAFWGPSVHWNSYLEQYVMLLNHASDSNWHQEGVYIAFSRSLDDPTDWSDPQLLLAGGNWYPQVIGIEPGGSDKVAGERARFFMSGRSRYFIQFTR
jgi:hypothetical protein